VDVHRVSSLRAQGLGWRKISQELQIGVGTLYRLAAGVSKIQEKVSEPYNNPQASLEQNVQPLGRMIPVTTERYIATIGRRFSRLRPHAHADLCVRWPRVWEKTPSHAHP